MCGRIMVSGLTKLQSLHVRYVCGVSTMPERYYSAA